MASAVLATPVPAAGTYQPENADSSADHVHDDTSGHLSANILAARVVANALRPSLGRHPSQSGLEILSKLQIHDNSAAQQLFNLAQHQHQSVGDGTSTAVILAGSMLDSAARLLDRGTNKNIPLSAITTCFVDAADYAAKVITDNAQPVEIADPEVLINLCSQQQQHYSSSHADVLTRLTVDSILDLDKQSPPDIECIPNLSNIRVVGERGGNVEDSCVFPGLILARPNGAATPPDIAPKCVEDAKIALLDYWLTPTEIDADCDDETREEVLREDRKKLLSDCKQIKKSGARVVLIAAKNSTSEDGSNDEEKKSIDGLDVNLQICLHFLAKMNIMVISDLQSQRIDSISKILGCSIIAYPDNISPQELGYAKRVEDVESPSGNTWIHFEGTAASSATIMLHGPGDEVLAESERAIDALLVFVGNLFRDPRVVAGGGAAEIQAALQLKAQTLAMEKGGIQSKCTRAFADALEVIPFTLSENADINPAAVVTALRRQHAEGQLSAGLDLAEVGGIRDMYEANIVQPLVVLISAIQLATTTACNLLKADHTHQG